MSTLIILDHTGHTSIEYDVEEPDTVEAAAAEFFKKVEQGWVGYTVEGGVAQEVVREFDPNAEEIRMRFPMAGG